MPAETATLSRLSEPLNAQSIPSGIRVDILLPHLHTGGIELGLLRLAPDLCARGFDLRFVVQRAEGDLLDRARQTTKVHALNTPGMWPTARAYARLLARDPVDLVYTATNAMNVAQLLAGRLLRRAAPSAIVAEHIPLNGFLASRKRPWLRRLIMRATYSRAAALAAPISDILDEHRTLLGASCPAGHVLPNPVIEVLPELPQLRPQAHRFVALGRLSPEKGFDLALETMAAYRRHDPKARLIIYGEGTERARLEALRASLGLEDIVSLPGRTVDVAKALSDADLFLCTSLMEGFGNAIVEAQGAGVPVVSVDCPFGPRHLLQDGSAGCLIPSRDPEMLATCIADFSTSLAARKSAQSRGRDVASGYTLQASADAHAALFARFARQSLR